MAKKKIHGSIPTIPSKPTPHSPLPIPLNSLAVALGWLAWAGLHAQGEMLPLANNPTLTLWFGALIFLLMLGCVAAVVHHADHLADRLQEPYGTLVLTLSATIIEVSLMLRVMFHGEENPTLLRDTVFAVLMICANGTIGLALLAGGWRHIEQTYNLRGAIAFVQLIAPLSLLLLVLPDYTTSTREATLTPPQEAYLGCMSVVVYALFLWIQTGRHRSHFDHSEGASPSHQRHKPLPGNGRAIAGSIAKLIGALLPMVLLSEYLGQVISFGIEEMKLPAALGGLVIASIGLVPEITATLRAAWANEIQRSVNICLGSALSTIGLTVPTMMIVAAYMDKDFLLGLSGTNKTLLIASLLVMILTFVSGAANMLQGIVHLMLFSGYIILILYP
jgi:Ca2+:H+ antiporter